jgi:geranylgeranyl pyrophosphate synthase
MTECYTEYKRRVEGLIKVLIEEKTEKPYRQFLEYAMSGGKRIRSIIALSIIDKQVEGMNLSEQTRTTVELTCLVSELLHSSSLIIDDLPCMDDAKVRRGRPCMHVKYDEAVAILTTAHLLTMSTRLYTWSYNELKPFGLGCPENLITLVEKVSTCMSFEGASGGQMMDLQRVVTHEPDALKKMMSRKTSSFFQISITGAVLVCASLPLSDRDLSRYMSVSDLTGIAFQIYDDFEDILEDDGGSNNSVTSNGVHACYLQFTNCVSACKNTLRDLGSDTQVFDDIMHMMRMSIERKMNGGM